MVDVLSEIVIDRPVADVSSFASDPGNAPAWYENIKSVEWKSDPVVVGGARVAFVAHFLGRKLAYTYEITTFDPGRRLTMRTAEGPFPMETTYTWEPVGESSTRMTLGNRGEPRGFSSLVAPFMAMAMRRANEADLKKLKGLLESRR